MRFYIRQAVSVLHKPRKCSSSYILHPFKFSCNICSNEVKKGIGICRACFSATFVVYIITTNVKMPLLTETKVNVKTGLLLVIIPSKKT